MGFTASVVLAASLILTAQGRPGGRVAGGWEGLMHKQIVTVLPGQKNKRIGAVSFAYAIIRDQKTFDALNKVADAKPHDSVHAWDAWAGSLDWDREVVVCVVRTAPTNLLKLGRLSSSRDGGWNLGLRFSAIEPAYGDHYPVVLYRFSRGKRDKVAVSIDMDNAKSVPLGVVDLSDPAKAGAR